DAGGERPLAVRADHRRLELLPVRAAIVAAIDVDRRGAGENPLGLAAVDHEAPDLLLGVGEAGAPESGTAVGAAPHAVVGAGEHGLWILLMNDTRVGLPGAQHVLPVAPRRGAAKHADLARMIRFAEVACDTDIDLALVSHGCL